MTGYTLMHTHACKLHTNKHTQITCRTYTSPYVTLVSPASTTFKGTVWRMLCPLCGCSASRTALMSKGGRV